MSTVSNRGCARWRVCQGALDSALLIRFLERLVRSMKGRKVYLILDNLRVHHSKLVKVWLGERREVIAVYHLPSYSPDINPDERLSHSLKSELSYLPAAKDKRTLQKQIIGSLRFCQKQPEHVGSFFTSSSTRHAA